MIKTVEAIQGVIKIAIPDIAVAVLPPAMEDVEEPFEGAGALFR